MSSQPSSEMTFHAFLDNSFISKFDYIERQQKASVTIQLESPDLKLAAHLENVYSQKVVFFAQ